MYLFSLQRYISERGDAVAKASKETHVVSFLPLSALWQPVVFCEYTGNQKVMMMWPLALTDHQMDYRSLVHEKDQAIMSEIRVILLDIRGFYVSWSDWKWSTVSKFLFPRAYLEKCIVFCRRRCTTSSTRTWIRWPIQKERRNPPCTEDQETNPTINFLASQLVSHSHIKTVIQQIKQMSKLSNNFLLFQILH